MGRRTKKLRNGQVPTKGCKVINNNSDDDVSNNNNNNNNNNNDKGGLTVINTELMVEYKVLNHVTSILESFHFILFLFIPSINILI
jgi:hypothetical protein